MVTKVTGRSGFSLNENGLSESGWLPPFSNKLNESYERERLERSPVWKEVQMNDKGACRGGFTAFYSLGSPGDPGMHRDQKETDTYLRLD